MIQLVVSHNKVYLSKNQQGWHDFVVKYLIKFEDVRKPDFYNSTKSRKVYKTVKERRNLYLEDKDYVYFTRGVLSLVPPIYEIKELHADTITCPEINQDKIRTSLKSFDLREDQVVAVMKCLVNKRGVIQLPTAIGKSAVIATTIKSLLEENPDMKILVLAPTLSTVENINNTFLREDIDTSIFGHPDKEIKTSVTTALVQSLVTYSKTDPTFLTSINAVFYDECHHLKCDTWNHLNSLLCNVEYSLGFSALSIDKSEIFLRDLSEISYESALIMSATGQVLMHMDPSYYIEKGIIALPVLFRIHHQVELPEGFDESVWAPLVKEGLMSTTRVMKVVRCAKMFSKYNRKVLILISEKSLAFTICQHLVRQGVTDFGVSFGAGKGYTFKDIDPQGEVEYNDIDSLEVLDMLNENKLSIIIGTSHVDEGVDLNNLDCLILACGGKKDRRVIQRVGRVLRPSKTGKYAYVVDFTDEGSRVLSRQSNERFKMYRDSIGIPKQNLYDGISIENLESQFKKLEGLDSTDS